MELPVDNKKRALAHTLVIVFLIIALCLLIYFNTYNLSVIYTGLVLVIVDLLIGFYSLRKHDIKKAKLSDDKIEIYHRRGLIIIPLREITNVYSGLNYFIDLKGRLSNTYILHFNTKYIFGNKLYLKYNFPKVDMNNEPIEIQIFKANIKNQNNETI